MKKHLSILMLLVFSCLFVEEVGAYENSDQKKEVPDNVLKWIQTELTKAKNKTSLSKEDFFCKDSAKLIGYIKGYDANSGLTSGQYNVESEVTGEGYPKNVEIHSDGRFEVIIPMEHPLYTYINFKKENISFYIEPGQTLAIILDWSEFLSADSLQNNIYEFKNIVFMGPSATINADLTKYKQKEVFHSDGATMANKLTPAEFKSRQKQALTNYLDKLDKANQEGQFSPKAIELLKNKFLLSYATSLFEYVTYRGGASTFVTKLKTTVPLGYYDFLKELPLNDQNLLISYDFLAFIHNFEYCEPLRNAAYYLMSNYNPKSFFAYLIEDEKIKLTADEMALKLWADTTRFTIITPENKVFLEEKIRQVGVFDEKYKKYEVAYEKKTYKPIPPQVDIDLERCFKKDSILINELKLNPSLAYEITKIRQFAAQLQTYDKKDAIHYYDRISQTITNPFLKQEGEALLQKSFKGVYELPAEEGTKIFRKIIDPYKGKVLFVDFWATSCGPCVGNIKAMKAIRDKYQDNKDFEFIFITDDGGSPLVSYNKFVEDQHLIHSYRLPKKENICLYNLFCFNAIPHYVVIDREGKVINDDFHMFLFENELQKILNNN